METAELNFREAVAADLDAIVRMLADDHLGQAREDLRTPLAASYRTAFDAIDADPNNAVVVACVRDAVVGTLQLTFTPSLSYRGSWRATIESVRTDSALRGRGIGAALMRHAIEMARARGCILVQLSTHNSRPDARRFYERLGFAATHTGMKLSLKE